MALALLVWSAFLAFIWARGEDPRKTVIVIVGWSLFWPVFLGWVLLRLAGAGRKCGREGRSGPEFS